jgi:membrane fusion protein (multidrug efflux system)
MTRRILMSTKNIISLTIFLSVSTLILSCCSKESNVKKEEKQSQEEQVQTVPVVPVQKLQLHHELNLPGELLAYQNVPIHAKVEGFIKWIGVDRGSIVKKGQKMILVFCPELDEKTKEAAAKVSSAEASYRQSQSALQTEISKQVEGKAKLDADKLTFNRLKQAAKTPGAIAQNEIDIADKTVEADVARVNSEQSAIDAARALVIAEEHNYQASRQVLASLKDMLSYLTICAPFDGVITERNVHEGSIVGIDAIRSAIPLVRIQEKDILRLVVAVPEASVSGISIGQKLQFSVPAFVGRVFEGIVARPAYALDNATRTMPVELNVYNTDNTLEPGMFATVHWTVTRPNPTLFVPTSAVESDLKGTFVIRVKNDTTERIAVHPGLTMDSLIEISGSIKPGDLVALKATNEYKDGSKVKFKLPDSDEIKNASKHSSAGGE